MILWLKKHIKKMVIGVQFFFIRLAALFTGADNDRENVLLDLSGLKINRRIVQVALQLTNAGFSVYYKAPSKLYVDTVYNGFDGYQQFFFDRVRYHHPKRNYKVVFCAENKADSYPKRIVFYDDIPSFHDHFTEDFFYPILFHPCFLVENPEKANWNTEKKMIKMLFIGNNADTYQNFADTVHQTYGIKTRNEVIAFLCSRFDKHIFRPDSKEQFLDALNDTKGTLKNKIVIIDRFRLEGEDYWNALRRSACHIWTCGYIQPYCHNQMESIFSNAVPVTDHRIKYNGLNDDKAYLYSDSDQMAAVVEHLLQLDIESEELLRKRKQVDQLYRDHYSNRAFKNKLIGFIQSDKPQETYYICHSIYQ